jgi:bla regulator protein BlaR1
MLWLSATGLAAINPLQSWSQASAVPNAKNPKTPLPEFEVVSIRPSGPNRGEVNELHTYPGGRIRCNGGTVQYPIMSAFDVQQFQISGGPDWISVRSGDRSEIEAKPPDSSPSTQSIPSISKLPPSEEQRQMLLSMLINRFELKFHRMTKEGCSVYILTMGEKELKLQPPKDKTDFPWAGSIEGGKPSTSGVRGQNILMALLASRLRGSFDFKFQTGDADLETDNVSSILTSIKEIGLKLSSSKGPVESIAIDHIEKPSAN